MYYYVIITRLSFPKAYNIWNVEKLIFNRVFYTHILYDVKKYQMVHKVCIERENILIGPIIE